MVQADHAVKKKRLKLVERQIKQLTESQRMSIGTESEDFDEVQQFQALLAQANVELAYKKLWCSSPHYRASSALVN